MKHIYAVKTEADLQKLQTFARKIQSRLDNYLQFLEKNYQVTDLPRCVLWTDCDTATHLIQDIPVPAYTNDYRTVFCPDLETWREIYLHQLDAGDDEVIRKFYEEKLTENHILQILGHEFVHHSAWFSDEDSNRESGIWFEEGMCEYISRRYFLTKSEFEESILINQKLTDYMHDRYGETSLEAFGTAVYQGDYAGIFYGYWRSFLAVKALVDSHCGDVSAVLKEYRDWLKADCPTSLACWFHLE